MNRIFTLHLKYNLKIFFLVMDCENFFRNNELNFLFDFSSNSNVIFFTT